MKSKISTAPSALGNLDFFVNLLGSQSKLINEGIVQKNFKFKEGVLHIGPSVRGVSKEEYFLANRWLYPDKGRVIKKYVGRNVRTINNVEVIKIIHFGNIRYADDIYPYWFDRYIEGVELDSHQKYDLSLVSSLFIWLAKLHSSPFVKRVKLRRHYSMRLSSMEKYLQGSSNKFSPTQLRDLMSVIRFLQNIVEKAVDSKEWVVPVHGDFVPENVIVGNDRLHVIDFEQGIFGGDYYHDLNRWLEFNSDSKMDIKRNLLNEYLQSVSDIVKNSTVIRFLSDGAYADIRNRDILSRGENILSIMFYRYLTGWESSIETDKIDDYIKELKKLVNARYEKETISL